jgi:hypothetical protein
MWLLEGVISAFANTSYMMPWWTCENSQSTSKTFHINLDYQQPTEFYVWGKTADWSDV